MTPRIPVTTSAIVAWVRQCATTVNNMLGRIEAAEATIGSNADFPFERLASAPASPDEGRSYYDLTLHKARVFDGTSWQALW